MLLSASLDTDIDAVVVERTNRVVRDVTNSSFASRQLSLCSANCVVLNSG